MRCDRRLLFASGREVAVLFFWPDVNGGKATWTGCGFLVDDQARAILDYGAGQSGWDDELTRFHEDVAGDGTHPIDAASRRCARAALRRHLDGKPVILEVGSSSGFRLGELAADWPDGLIIGSDFIAERLVDLARREPSVLLLRFDRLECPIPSGSVEEAQQPILANNIRRTRQGPWLPWTMAIEERLRDWVDLPFGIRGLAVAVKA